jgi:hypothetical protein
MSKSCTEICVSLSHSCLFQLFACCMSAKQLKSCTPYSPKSYSIWLSSKCPCTRTASLSLEELANNAYDGLAGSGIWSLLPVCGVPLNHQSNKLYFIFRSVSQANTVNMNVPPLYKCTVVSGLRSCEVWHYVVWWMRTNISQICLKCLYLCTKLHIITSQKTIILSSLL